MGGDVIEGLFTFIERDIVKLTGSPVGVPVRALALTFGKKGRSPPGNPLPASLPAWCKTCTFYCDTL